MVIDNYKRDITHKDYKNPEKLKKYYHRVEKKVYQQPIIFDNDFTNGKFSDYIFFDDNFIVSKTGSVAIPLIGGIISALFVIIFLIPSDEKMESIDWVLIVLGVSSTIFFLIYGLTMPKKENILNRKNGLITFTGFFWQKNITMFFDKVEFAYSTGGENAIGSFELQVVRPNKWQTFAIAGYLGIDCYENMSFICWYMDKNRPLPPGEIFDKFRDADYERRKAEGFSKPLYPSMIETPEATKEQQKERERIGGW